jgi:hypothetical protein
MSTHVWRQGHGIDPMREWMRRELPGSKDGMVLVDLDLAVRRYGNRYGLDAEGDLLLLEKKEYIGQLTPGEKRVYDWIDKAIKASRMITRWRGWNLLKIVYRDTPRICDTCKQPIESPDQAYERFSKATLYLGDKEISHTDLKSLLEKK